MKDFTKELLAEKLFCILQEDVPRFNMTDLDKLDILSLAIKIVESGTRPTDGVLFNIKKEMKDE